MPPPTRDRARRQRGGPESDARARRAVEAQQAAYEASRSVLAAAARRRDAAWRRAASENRRRALLALVAPLGLAIVLMAVGVVSVSALIAGLVLAVGIGIASFFMWLRSSARLASRLGGTVVTAERRPASIDAVAAARLVDVTESLSSVFGLQPAELRVLDDDAPNAISVGRIPDHGVVFVTSGLVGLLDRIELEAVLAHELAHLKRGDTVSGTIAVVAFGPVGRTIGALSKLTDAVAGADRESLADLAAVAVTRYPPGLVSALGKLEEAPTRRPTVVPKRLADATECLWLVPFDPPVDRAVRRGALDLGERIDALREL